MAVAVYIGSKTHLLQLLMRFACNANIQSSYIGTVMTNPMRKAWRRGPRGDTTWAWSLDDCEERVFTHGGCGLQMDTQS